jgi:hypothetical protein
MLLEIEEKMTFHSSEEKREWIDEAYEFRLPYWDWALKGTGIPYIFTVDDIDIRQPKAADGKPVKPLTVPNPLSRFQTKDEKTGELLAMGKLGGPDGKYNVPDNTATDDDLPVREKHSFFEAMTDN